METNGSPNAVSGAAMPGAAAAITQLACQIEALRDNLDWTLAHFVFVAAATALSEECDIVCSPAMSVVSYHGPRFPELAFWGESPELLRTYTTFLVEPGSEVHLLVSTEQRAIAEQAFAVIEIRPSWQLVFAGETSNATSWQRLDPGEAIPLKPRHLAAMQALAQKAEISTVGEELFERGPAMGIWEGRTLVAMGVTRTRVPGVAEIGKIAVHPDYRQRGYTANIVAALLQSLLEEEPSLTVFTMVQQGNTEALLRYEALGFERARPMYLMRCLVADEQAPAAGSAPDPARQLARRLAAPLQNHVKE
ncbi:MAG: GNAT family N-acetyltransferase [Anaerolineae bacterium]|nr:GNAT family N-acetyltransferase [Anaerolineae bacterium]